MFLLKYITTCSDFDIGHKDYFLPIKFVSIIATMRKYSTFFKVNFLNFLEYRTDIVTGFLLKLGVFLCFVFVWRKIAAEGKEITGYGLSGITFYYLATQVLDALVSSQAARDLRRDIISGELSNKLIKPFRITSYFFCRHLAMTTIESVTYSILVIPVIFLYPDIFASLHLTVQNLAGFLISIICASVWSFTLYLSVGYIAFWTKEAAGLQMVIKNAIRFFTGGLIPLDLLPLWFQKISFVLPFSYSLFFPVKILMGEISSSELVKGFATIFTWIIFFMVFNIIIWRKGIKQYESVGI